MKPRFFHAFKFKSALARIHEVTSEGKSVLMIVRKGTNKDYVRERVRDWRSGEERIDASKVLYSDEEYNEDLYDEYELENIVDCINDPKASFALAVLVDHGNRTPHLASLLARTNISVISASPRRVVLKKSTDEETPDKMGEHSDPNFLYSRPEVPNFDNLTDAQLARFVRDDTRSLDALFPVYDFSVKAIKHHEFLNANIPQRTPLVLLDGVPMLFSESITELYAWRGTGKTLFALSLAYHLAAGESFLGMSIPSAAKVLYVEGELPAGQLRDRCKQLSSHLDVPEGNFTLLSKSLQGRDRDQSPVTIKTEAGRAAIEAEIERTGASVLILDSIASLAQISTNNEDNWIPIIEWLVDLRCKGICVMYLQQAGKGGEQRGHSISEDRIDQAIKLTATYTNPGAAAFEVSFHKPREQGKLDPFRVRCTAGVWERDSSVKIKSAKAKKPTKHEHIVEALNNNEPQRKIAKRLKVSLERISKIKKEQNQHEVPSEATIEQ